MSRKRTTGLIAVVALVASGLVLAFVVNSDDGVVSPHHDVTTEKVKKVIAEGVPGVVFGPESHQNGVDVVSGRIRGQTGAEVYFAVSIWANGHAERSPVFHVEPAIRNEQKSDFTGFSDIGVTIVPQSPGREVGRTPRQRAETAIEIALLRSIHRLLPGEHLV